MTTDHEIVGMETWTWFDEICLRIYAKIASTTWYWEERFIQWRKK